MLASTMTAMLKTSSGRSNQAQILAMQTLMQQMFGETIPTLRSIIGSEKVPSVTGSTTVREAAKLMSSVRKGVLVMDKRKGTLLGIFTPKDLLSRVVAKNLSADDTLVSSVMTPNPDFVSPELTLLDALREMHDHKYLHLPVREESGRVLGLVDVMELVCQTAGGEGGKGWRDFFSGAMDARGDGDSVSDTASDYSRGTASTRKKNASAGGVASSKASQDRSVAKLRPKAPITVKDTASILEVTQAMSAVRADAAQNGLPDHSATREVTTRSLCRLSQTHV